MENENVAEKKKVLVVVDMQYMFHRHLYRIREDENKKRQALLNRTGRTSMDELTDEEIRDTYMLSFNGIETARLYFAMKDFNEIRAFAEKNGADMCICLDSKSDRKEENTDYKANRNRLVNVDIAALSNIEYVLQESGFAVVKESGYEADDLIASVVRNHGSEYENVIIFTPDADLCALVKDNVAIKRYKSVYSKLNTFLYAHEYIDTNSLSDILSAEYKTEIPYNAVILYKVTVGDKSDGIKGIKGFGPAAFRKFIDNLKAANINFTELTSADKVEELINRCSNILGESGVAQAIDSLELVRSRTNDSIEETVRGLDMTIAGIDKYRAVLKQFGITSL